MKNITMLELLKIEIQSRNNLDASKKEQIFAKINQNNNFNNVINLSGKDLNKVMHTYINEAIYQLIQEKVLLLFHSTRKNQLAEIFIKIHDKKDQLIKAFEVGYNMNSYLWRMVNNMKFDGFRVEKKQEILYLTLIQQQENNRTQLTFFNQNGVSVNADILRKALELLEQYSVKQAAAFELRHFESKTFKSIAAEMCISPTAANNLFKKAQNRLQLIIKQLVGVSTKYKGTFVYAGE